eukprot:jgi/Tetstr1/454748/TSEL_041634.t1
MGAPRSAPGAERALAIDAASIAAFSVLGVATRVAFDEWFNNCPPEDEMGGFHPWALCITSEDGALFADLPANMVACLIMGLLVPSSAFPDLHPANPRHVAILPGSWKIQHYTPLWLGIRTGFCGSLSTFASWNLQMVEMICDYQRSWEAGDAVFGYIIGTALAVAMVSFGIHVAGVIYCKNAAKELAAELPATEAAAGGPLGLEAEGVRSLRLELEIEEGLPGCGSDAQQPANGAPKPPAPSPPPVRSVAGDVGTFLFLAAVLAAAGLVAGLVPALRLDALACIAGPLGAWTRWQLGRFNGSWTRHPWLPLGTFAANTVAATADALLLGLQRYAGRGTLFDGAAKILITGVMGSMSTVSTLALEMYKLLDLPTAEGMKPYAYGGMTIGASVLLGVIAYGPFLWSSTAVTS